ncbi:MAG: hypothetical protein SF028_09595 [Candidatus Sumerlaeia bacterium]|nr:hypothetical protein [Candidatus Sumerlaeia bacterium]
MTSRLVRSTARAFSLAFAFALAAGCADGQPARGPARHAEEQPMPGAERKPVIHLATTPSVLLVERRPALPGAEYAVRTLYLSEDGTAQWTRETSGDVVLAYGEGEGRRAAFDEALGFPRLGPAGICGTAGTLEVLRNLPGEAPSSDVWPGDAQRDNRVVGMLDRLAGAAKAPPAGARWLRAVAVPEEQTGWMEEAGMVCEALDKALAKEPALAEALNAPGRMARIDGSNGEPLSSLPDECRDGTTATVRRGGTVYQVRLLRAEGATPTFEGPQTQPRKVEP